MRGPARDLTSRILRRSAKRPFQVWTPVDFLDLAPRVAIDKALQRLARAGRLRRIDRGLYDRPNVNRLTGKPRAPDHRAVIDAVARRDHLRVLVDAMTAANDLGLTTAVPARIVAHTEARLRPIRLGKLEIRFKPSAPGRLYWAGRPAMRIVQALHWLNDMISADRPAMIARLHDVLRAAPNGGAIRRDLRQGLGAMPTWMQSVVTELLDGRSVGERPDQLSGEQLDPSERLDRRVGRGAAAARRKSRA